MKSISFLVSTDNLGKLLFVTSHSVFCNLGKVSFKFFIPSKVNCCEKKSKSHI
ncbi:MAG: hypothetical protein BWY04_00060 [candidate division CPR1 bacterium ADurb.Bin160]|uniref:Uncharacterized protein n=1 Tax=candidate division CPR1 bacterium ADurb.Bin160 TaxID=1852826 RepID=A0A1V5ZS24_9BACT|nr:MAG: hypothetical protein BWY04_00060 [candidate division CPR1 bacterium ADurb.Bin160]